MKIGGNRETNFTEIRERNLTISRETPDHKYFRKPFKFLECGGRVAASKQQGLIKMETLPKHFNKSARWKNTQSRFVCIKAVLPATLVLCLGIWPFKSRDRYPTTDLGQSIPLCISPILPYSANPEEVACHTNLAVSIWYPLLLEMAIVHLLLLTRNTSLINPQGEVHPLIANRTLNQQCGPCQGKIA